MESVKIITWNVNSIRIRMDLFKKLVAMENPDVVCLQEVKAKNEDFPFDEIKGLGFENIALYGMAGYNGVAIISKLPLKEVVKLDWVGKKDARNIKALILDDIEISNIYIPAGGDVPDPIENLSFAHKLAFMDDVSEWCELNKTKLKDKKMIVVGDFNVAPLENDVWNHKQMLKVVSHTPVEVERLGRFFKSLDFVDAVREKFPEPQKVYTWWSYRNPNWQTNNKGRRLDHIWVSPNLKDRIVSVRILKETRAWERPSDHVPVVLELKV